MFKNRREEAKPQPNYKHKEWIT